MTCTHLICDAYFDGRIHHSHGPYTLTLDDGRIRAIARGDGDAPAGASRVPFIMPGLVEAHAHLFLDGAELDFETRKNHLKAPFDDLLATARTSLRRNRQVGVTLLRDAGDIHGINTRIARETPDAASLQPQILSAGMAIRKARRYGSFMALETTDAPSIRETIHRLATQVDQLKVLLTGIIDFETGRMKGDVQFTRDEARLITRTAEDLGLRTFCHCSGADGLAIATEAGFNSIEHGFFMEERFLEVMAEKRIAWVPTFSPVQFQLDRPELAGWQPPTLEQLHRIIDQHLSMLARAAELGVPICAGSDAGSYGVPHGQGLIDELFFHRRAGLDLSHILASATSVPRDMWGLPDGSIEADRPVDLISLAADPWTDMQALRQVTGIWRGRHTSVFNASDGELVEQRQGTGEV